MFSSRQNVNTLTALLVSHGIRHAVVCPGSRNAPIVHNFNECEDITCYPVTDERSAGFVALGIAQHTDQPVAVCVTSGSALLNLAPAVAEASYQHQSLIVISADRPEAWIDQLDGQTILQPGALSHWVAKTVVLPENDRWYANRLVNEALIAATDVSHACVHINVPVSEPLFLFDKPELPDERIIRCFAPAADYDCLPQALVDGLYNAERPLIIFGQCSPRRFFYEGVDNLFSRVIVLHEALAPFTSVSHFDEVLSAVNGLALGDELLPDFILYVGDAIVSKRLKAFLRRATGAITWRVSTGGKVEDTFQNLSGILVGDVESMLKSLSNKLFKRKFNICPSSLQFRRQWLKVLSLASNHRQTFHPAYSQMAAVSQFEDMLHQVAYSYEVHYANSTAVRLANIYAHHPVWCNRGVNGIEGSLSTAVGFSLAAQEAMVFCVIGDLSFFYDQNALWNQQLRGCSNLRILLLNNGKGGIFDQLKGLEQSPARDVFVAGQHVTTAQGICQQNQVEYHAAHDDDSLCLGLDRLLRPQADSSILLEVFTSASQDAAEYQRYFRELKL